MTSRMSPPSTRRASAKVGSFRPLSYDGFIVTMDDCVLATQVHALAKCKCVQRDVFGLLHPHVATTRTLAQLDLEGRLLLADVVTGTVYDERTGLCLSGSPRLVVGSHYGGDDGARPARHLQMEAV